MAFTVMTDVPNPLFDQNGDPFSGAVLKAYEPGTTTPISIYIDNAGSSPQASITYNAEGKLEVSGNEILPYIDREHKWGIFANSTDAAADTPFYMGPFDDVGQGVNSSDNSVVKNFSTLAEAVADTGLVDGDTISIKERTTGNGGGGIWDVVLSSTVTENTYNIVQCTGVATLSLDLRMNGSIDVKAGGAVGDGITDDTGAILALNTAVDGGELFFPPGNYIIKSPIPTNVGAKYRGVSSSGSNVSKLTYSPDVAGGQLFLFDNNHKHIDIEDLYLQGNGVASGGAESAIDLYSTDLANQQHVQIRNCIFNQWAKAGVYLASQWIVKIDNCRFLSCGDSATPSALTGGIVWQPDSTLANWAGSGNIIQDCYFSGCSYGWYMAAPWNVTLINCVAENNAYGFYKSAGGSPPVLMECWFESNTNAPDIDGPVIVIGQRGFGWGSHSATAEAGKGSVLIDAEGVTYYRTTTPTLRINPVGEIEFDPDGTAETIKKGTKGIELPNETQHSFDTYGGVLQREVIDGRLTGTSFNTVYTFDSSRHLVRAMIIVGSSDRTVALFTGTIRNGVITDDTGSLDADIQMSGNDLQLKSSWGSGYGNNYKVVIDKMENQ